MLTQGERVNISSKFEGRERKEEIRRGRKKERKEEFKTLSQKIFEKEKELEVDQKTCSEEGEKRRKKVREKERKRLDSHGSHAKEGKGSRSVSFVSNSDF